MWNHRGTTGARRINHISLVLCLLTEAVFRKYLVIRVEFFVRTKCECAHDASDIKLCIFFFVRTTSVGTL